jgi:hypothetical protein
MISQPLKEIQRREKTWDGPCSSQTWAGTTRPGRCTAPGIILQPQKEEKEKKPVTYLAVVRHGHVASDQVDAQPGVLARVVEDAHDAAADVGSGDGREGRAAHRQADVQSAGAHRAEEAEVQQLVVVGRDPGKEHNELEKIRERHQELESVRQPAKKRNADEIPDARQTSEVLEATVTRFGPWSKQGQHSKQTSYQQVKPWYFSKPAFKFKEGAHGGLCSDLKERHRSRVRPPFVARCLVSTFPFCDTSARLALPRTPHADSSPPS